MELIPIGLGILFLFACAGFGFVYGVFIAKGKRRWLGLLIALIGVLGLFPLLVVSLPPNMSLTSLSGTYQGHFGDGDNTFVLHPDGTFDQQFVDFNGKVYTTKGTWNLDTIQPGSIDFKHYLDTIGDFGKPKPPEISSFSGAAPHWLDHSIYFSEDEDIKITRIKH